MRYALVVDPVTLSLALRIAVTSDWASVTVSGDVAWIRSWLREPYPVSDSCTALTGATAMSLGSVKPEPPFAASTATTGKTLPATAIGLDSGATLPKGSSPAVGPG